MLDARALVADNYDVDTDIFGKQMASDFTASMTPGHLETSLSPELPDRKRYAIKEKVNLGVY